MLKKKPKPLKKIPTKKKLVSKITATKKAVLPTRENFPVVAIGSSAGGLEAALELFRNLSPNNGLAYIYVQHISPNHKSMLTPIFSKITNMKVQEIENMEHIVPDNIYVIPNDRGIEVTDGHIKLIPRAKKGAAVTIDVLFSSLAETHKENVVGIILSGNGHDGTKGLQAIKKAGGLTFAQDDSAKAKSMPKSAVSSGMVDFVLSPKEIASKLNALGRSGIAKLTAKNKPKPLKKEEQEQAISDKDPQLKLILDELHKRIQVDFKMYKLATIKRRINHRMVQCGMQTLQEYSTYVLKKNKEIDLLYKDLLINITDFFRNPEAFQYLKKSFLPDLLKSKAQNEILRIWIPACSTGQEAYSLAMLITELQTNKAKKTPIQIFATDLSEQAIKEARIGDYSQKKMLSVGKRRTDRFFIKTGASYRITQELRNMCVFAPHNIFLDPPFSRIDFISCRNLLIYFDQAAQKKALATMSFALNETGYLLLGKSESIGTSSPFFSPISSAFKLYSHKKKIGTRKVPALALRQLGKSTAEKYTKPASASKNRLLPSDLDRTIDATLLALYMPACVIVNKSLEIIQFRGSTAIYLSHPTGNASLNILKMTRPEFVFELRNALHEVSETNAPVFKTGIQLNSHDQQTVVQIVSLEVRPLPFDWSDPLYLIVFSMQERERLGDKNAFSKNYLEKDSRLKKQIEELHKASAEMIAVIESQDRAYEDLQAANEEIISASEEFQTLNEELETSKEEIEATNEELVTTNQELQMRNEQLAESYNFAEALAETMHEPMLLLDKQLRVKSANKAFYKKFHLMQSSTEGVLLFDLSNHQWDMPDLRQLLDNILQKNTHFYEHVINYAFPGSGKKTMLLNARPIVHKTKNEQLILVTLTESSGLPRKNKSENKKLEAIITERTKALEASYRTVNEKNVFLEKANKELETFTFISSHDLQEPLRKIKIFTTALLENEKENLSANGKEDLDKVQKTVSRMQTLIDDLLVYAGVADGKQAFEEVDISQVVTEVMEDFKELISEKKALITIDGNCHPRVILFQFRQLIHNLIGNALKFTHTKRFPRITIKCERTPGRLLAIPNAPPDQEYCHISIADNGIGLEPKYETRIFEVFQRLHGQQVYKGTGMGLAICKRIIENHKGLIRATGRLNKGATFDIYLPNN